MKKPVLHVIITVLFFTACERVIDVDLNVAAAALVVEGRILKDAPAFVELHETSSYFTPDTQRCVCSALVLIRENDGPADTLEQIAPGKFRSNIIYGKEGSNYTLEILYRDQVFSAESFLG